MIINTFFRLIQYPEDTYLGNKRNQYLALSPYRERANTI